MYIQQRTEIYISVLQVLIMYILIKIIFTMQDDCYTVCGCGNLDRWDFNYINFFLITHKYYKC
jgi:hypothetical protein